MWRLSNAAANAGRRKSLFLDNSTIQRSSHSRFFSAAIGGAAAEENKRQVLVIGAGHNGLTAAAYLAKHGLDVLVLERRHVVGE
jgi:ribulose 1,5-bisphosphate synthetase/thiazole synthase